MRKHLPFRVWSGPIIWNRRQLRAFAREARAEIHRRHLGHRVTWVRIDKTDDFPFTLLDVAYRLEGETRERFVHVTPFDAAIQKRSRSLPIA
jgi:hypothetical protein